jgi:hypothetical protein
MLDMPNGLGVPGKKRFEQEREGRPFLEQERMPGIGVQHQPCSPDQLGERMVVGDRVQPVGRADTAPAASAPHGVHDRAAAMRRRPIRELLGRRPRVPAGLGTPAALPMVDGTTRTGACGCSRSSAGGHPDLP